MRRFVRSLSVCGVLSMGSAAMADRVYVMTSELESIDNQVVAALSAAGHTGVIGVPYHAFNGTQSLNGFDSVYVQTNYNWNSGDMPLAGQSMLRSFVAAGGGLVTCEWLVWKTAAQLAFQELAEVLPVEVTADFTSPLEATFTAVDVDPVVHAGLPGSFTVPLDNFGGSETHLVPRKGSLWFFRTNEEFGGVIGGFYGEGRVVSCSTLNGEIQMGDPDWRVLMGNLFEWVGGALGCRADWTEDGIINAADVGAYLTSYFGDLTNGTTDADFDFNGITNSSDVGAFLTQYFATIGVCP